MRIRMLMVAALMTVVVSAFAPAAHAGQRKQMIRTINYVRSWSHLRGLNFSRRLSRGAAAWARHLMGSQTLAHATGQQGEVIEWHTGAQAQIKDVVTEWFNSSGHRRVMLGNYRRAGAGKAVGYFGGQQCTIWVVRFAGG
jgi:uncharacterized protein YkwD